MLYIAPFIFDKKITMKQRIVFIFGENRIPHETLSLFERRDDKVCSLCVNKKKMEGK